MDYRKIVDKLEHDLSHFLIDELTKSDPSKRQSAEMYKYKGLGITVDPRSKAKDKIIAIRIGALEAKYKIGSGDKCSGNLTPKEEKLVSIWIQKPENGNLIRSIFNGDNYKREVSIVPFELDDIFEKND